jgi:hypothetical protein
MMVMVGPSLKIRWIAIPMATTAARIGMIQTTEIRWRRRGTTVARGRLSGLSAMVVPRASALSQPGTVTLISFTTKIIARRSRNQNRKGHCTTKNAKSTKFESMKKTKSFVAFVRFVVTSYLLVYPTTQHEFIREFAQATKTLK